MRCLAFELGEDRERIVAEHDGYRRLEDPVVHRREIVYDRSARLVRVTDRLHCAATHHIEIFWHLAKECVVRLDGDSATVTRDAVELVLRWPEPLTARLARGCTDPTLGWISDRFDQKVPGDTLVVAGLIGAEWQGVSTIKLSLERSRS